MLKTMLAFSVLSFAASAFPADQPVVSVEPSNLNWTAHLQDQTEKAVIQDYLQSWQTFSTAFEQNRSDMLDRDFVGSAKEKLASAIREQTSLGVHTRYVDRSHHLQVLFYSPEGLSIELADNVEYDVQVSIKDKKAPIQRMQAHYIVVLTPAEQRWRVRVFQAQAD